MFEFVLIACLSRFSRKSAPLEEVINFKGLCVPVCVRAHMYDA